MKINNKLKELFSDLLSGPLDEDNEEFLIDYEQYLLHGPDFKKINKWNQQLKELLNG